MDRAGSHQLVLRDSARTATTDAENGKKVAFAPDCLVLEMVKIIVFAIEWLVEDKFSKIMECLSEFKMNTPNWHA